MITLKTIDSAKLVSAPLWRFLMEQYVYTDLVKADEDTLGDLGGYFHIPESQEEVDLILADNTWDTWRVHPEICATVAWSATNNAGGHTYIIKDRFKAATPQEFDAFGDCINN